MPSRTLAVLAFAILAGGCQPPMQDFTSTQWKFKARFPGKPEEKSQPGPFGTTMTMFAVESRNGMMGVAAVDMPIPENESPAQIQARLDGARDGAIRNLGGTQKSSSEITLNGKWPGREYSASITKPTPGQVRSKIFLVGKRMYMVMVAGTDSYATSSNATAFLNSFQLIE